MNSIAIYLSSRNNYDLLESLFLRTTNLEGYQLYNIDDFSDEEEIRKGRDICERNNIKFIPNKDRGLQWAAQTVIDSVDDNVKYVIWCSHDTFPLTPNFFKKIDEKVKSGSLDQFGMVGFNAFGPQTHIHNPSDIKPNTCGILGRASLMKVLPNQKGAGWFRSRDVNLDWDVWGQACTVDAPNSFFEMFNVKLFRKYINPTNKFHLFFAHDDLAMQFLKNNVHNIVLPEFLIWHDQRLKTQFNIPFRSSSAAKKGDSRHFGDYGPHYEHWKERWGWYRQDRAGFEEVSDQYKGTLICDTYYHDFATGPLKKFNI